jgi:hydroxymethylbilane synthase
MSTERPILIATRGSPLALAQAGTVAAACRAAFPHLKFELSLIKTTGDKLQQASMARPGEALPKGLFTKELEVALLRGRADLAVHSLKDLPTELPDGLVLGAVLERADPRDVLVYRSEALVRQPLVMADARSTDWEPSSAPRRGFSPHLRLVELPRGAVIATSSTRRAEQVRALRPDLVVVEIRGNVGTRLQKLADKAELDATLLAAAGLARLGFRIGDDGELSGPAPDAVSPPARPVVPGGLLAVRLPVEDMLPCVGQAAIGIEVRAGDERLHAICAGLNHSDTFQRVTAERAFLHAMGGGCQSPVAAFAEVVEGRLRMRGVSFRDGPARRAEVSGDLREAVTLGEQLAEQLRPQAGATAGQLTSAA